MAHERLIKRLEEHKGSIDELIGKLKSGHFEKTCANELEIHNELFTNVANIKAQIHKTESDLVVVWRWNTHGKQENDNKEGTD